MDNILELLKDDNEYYYGVGRNYFSNSDIGKILDGTYAKEIDAVDFVPAFEFGKYVHTAILEPHKLDNFDIYEGTRREAEYKAREKGCMTRSEQRKAQLCIDAINASREGRGLLYGPGVTYEEPSIVEIDGVWWKGKADAINHDLKYVVDVKTTSDLYAFNQKALVFGYNSQAWLYWKLFGYPVIFVVVDKRSYKTAVIEFDRGFYQSGKDRVFEAIDIIKSNKLQ